MKNLFGGALVLLALLVGMFGWRSLHPVPNGEVVITDMNGGAEITVASR